MAKPKKVTLADGTLRWRVVYDAGRDPVTNKRRQITRTYDRKKDADAEVARVQHQRATGVYVQPSRLTVGDLLDSHLRHVAASGNREAATLSQYRHAQRPAREFLGERLAQAVTREDVQALAAWMQTGARKRGGTPGTGLGPRSIRLTLSRLSAAYDLAIDDGKVTANPCRRVELPRLPKPKTVTWSRQEAATFLATAAADRLHPAWRMTLYGLRREEICGLRWPDVDLDAGMLTVSTVRLVVDGKVIVKDGPKSEKSARTLPLDDALTGALRELRRRQAEEKLAAGEAYRPSGYVVSDEGGEAVNPESFSDEFDRLVKRAGVPRLTPHGARHTANSLMAAQGIPDHIRAAWCGHSVAVNKTTYTHARPEDLLAARDALSQVYGG